MTCVGFMQLAGRHRWAEVRPWMEDCNDVADVWIPVGEWMDSVSGTCGMRPDLHAMETEPISLFDLVADHFNWSPDERVRRWAIRQALQKRRHP